MNIRIDNYYINYNENNGIYSVCIDGQIIIHDSTCISKSCAIKNIVESIEYYNFVHGLQWGELK